MRQARLLTTLLVIGGAIWLFFGGGMQTLTRPPVNSEAIAYSDSALLLTVANSPATLERAQAIDKANNGNLLALLGMETQHLVTRISNGTRVRVLAYDGQAGQVTLLDGQNAGLTGWLATSELRQLSTATPAPTFTRRP